MTEQSDPAGVGSGHVPTYDGHSHQTTKNSNGQMAQVTIDRSQELELEIEEVL
jgi:hypothetical protein